MLTSALMVVGTDWTDQLEVVPLAGSAAVFAGLLLSLSAFRGWFSHLLSAIYGTAWVGFLVGRGLPGDPSWRERIFELGTRIGSWVQQALGGGTGQDPLIFLLFLSILFWALGYSAAWNTYRRRRAWLAAVPFGIVSIVVTHFYIGEAPLMRYLVLYLLLALLYVGRAGIFREEEIWRRERVAYDPKLGMDVLRSSLVIAILALAFAWTVPSTSSASTSASEVWERVNAPWEMIEEEWQRLFSSIHSGEREIAEPFGSSLALGGASDLGDTLVLDIKAPRDGRYYWRAAIYASYDGAQWHPPEASVVSLAPGERATAVMSDASRQAITQMMTNYLPGRHLLVGASQTVAVDREAEALARVEDGTALAFHRISSILPLGAGEQYTVTSRVSRANGSSLRQAGTDYPTWATEGYLRLPPSLPERVHTLAERIAGQGMASGIESPYDQARLLERYLRDTITYDLSPPNVPPGRDYVDFLLFDSQRAYCNGYATAMVVMARSVGIPARLVTGYAQGTYDEQRGVFRVHENNGHSWPELYFPGYGWIEFEPTVSQDPLIRPEPVQEAAPDIPPPPEESEDLVSDLRAGHEDSLPIPEDGVEAVPDQEVPSERIPLWPWAGGGLALAAMVAAGWWALENVGLRRLPTTEKAYARLLRFGRWLGRPLQVPDTPWEWGQDLSAMVPKAEEPITRIVGIYVEAQFGQGDLRDPAADISWGQARALLWRHLLWEQWLVRLGLSPVEA